MFRSKPHGLLLVLPAALVVLTALVLEFQGPYYLGKYFEDYPYLLNGLNLLTFHAPGHIDHPGTTLQVLSALVIFCKWMVAVVSGSWVPLRDTVLTNPESYLRIIGLVLNLLTAAAMYLAGRRVYQLTNSLVAGLILQASPFIFYEALLTQIRVQGEPLLTAAGLALVIPLAPLIFQRHTGANAEDARLAVVAGIIIGFGVVSKITFAPLGLFFFLFTGRRARLRFAVSAALSAFIFLLPALPHFPRMARWFVSLLTHSERYGQGRVGLPTFATLSANFSKLYHFEPGLFWFLACYLAILAALLVSRGLRDRLHDPAIVRFLMVGCASAVLSTAVTVKHCAAHYLVAALAIIPLLNAALFWTISSSSLSRAMKRVLLGVGLAVPIASAWHTARLLNTWTREAIDYRDEIRLLETALSKERGCLHVAHYRSSLAGFALAFGDEYSSRVHWRFIASLYPDLVYFNIFGGQIWDSTGVVTLSDIRSWVEKERCVLWMGTALGLEDRALLPSLALKSVIEAGGEGISRVGLDPAVQLLNTDPPPDAVVLEAEDLAAGTVVVDKTFFGLGIGVLTSPRYPARAEYQVRLPAAGRYEVRVRYASADSRPLKLSANGRLLTDAACSAPTGGYSPTSQIWLRIGFFDLAEGGNLIELASELPFPHVDKLAFIPAGQ